MGSPVAGGRTLIEKDRGQKPEGEKISLFQPSVPGLLSNFTPTGPVIPGSSGLLGRLLLLLLLLLELNREL